MVRTTTGANNASGITTDSTDTFTNKTINDTSNTVTSDNLRSASGVIDYGSADAPTQYQVPMADSGTAITWSDPLEYLKLQYVWNTPYGTDSGYEVDMVKDRNTGMVWATFPLMTGVATTAATFNIATAIPVAWRPAQSVYGRCLVQSNNAYTTGTYMILTTGIIAVGLGVLGTTNFSNVKLGTGGTVSPDCKLVYEVGL